MIDLNTPPWLTRKFAFDSFSDISHAASDPEWLAITTEWMLDLIAYSEKKYGDKIDGYILSGGGTSEWYEYDRGRSSRTKNRAWREWCKRNNKTDAGPDVPPENELGKARHDNAIYDPAVEPEKIYYWRFHNEIVASALLHFARNARMHVPKQTEIGVFFGYYLVAGHRLVSFGHLDYERVFASPDIDFVIGPGCYDDRAIGGGSGAQFVHGTVDRYGKRSLHEIDHRTHLIAKPWKSREDDLAGLTREAAFALVNRMSYWWFDMWGGWYQETAVQQHIGRLHKIADQISYADVRSTAQVLLVADPQSAYLVNEKSPIAPALGHQFRNKLNRTGTPFDVYSFQDLAVIDLSQYKLICLPATFLITPERAELLRNRVCKDNRTLIWVYAPGICNGADLDKKRVEAWTGTPYMTPGPTTKNMGEWISVYSHDYKSLTPSVLRKIMSEAGVHLYTEENVPVYANTRLLAIHFAKGGKKKISLPFRYRRVTDLLRNKVAMENASEFFYTAESPDTALFECLQ